MTTPDIIHVIKPGKLEADGKKLRLGEMVQVPVDQDKPDGPTKLTMKLGNVCLKLGNGVEAVGGAPGMVALEVTAAAAKRLGWPHPANEPKPVPNVAVLRAIVCNDAYGQQERLAALREIEAVDPAQANALRAAYSWLEAA
jgi:hypothetical protein